MCLMKIYTASFLFSKLGWSTRRLLFVFEKQIFGNDVLACDRYWSRMR
jgi:hypothetical protein